MSLKIDDMRIYPTEYFAAKDYETGKISITENTISIHQYNASWQTPKQKIAQKIKYYIGNKNFERMKSILKTFKK